MLKKFLLAVCIVLSAFIIYSCFDNPSSNDDPIDPVTDSQIDSLFTILVTRVNSLEDVEDYDDFYAIHFKELSVGFSSFLSTKPNHIKVNTGYIVSSVLALNKSGNLKMLADSLDVFFKSLDSLRLVTKTTRSMPMVNGFLSSRLFCNRTTSHMMRNTFDKHGVNGLGVALAARTPEIIGAQMADPTFPRFLTISFLQGIAQNEIIPVLDSVVLAFSRLEAIDTMNLVFTMDGEEVEIDLGDVYIVDAGIRLLRAQLLMLCTYDYDLFTSAGNQTYSWIDDMIDVSDQDITKSIYSLQGDTITETEIWDDSPMMLIMCDVTKYNYVDRPDFLKIKTGNHTKAYNDYLAAPDLIKLGIAYIKNESDDQNNDVIPKVEIDDINGEMVDIKQDMIEEGFSTTFANNFQSPEALMDFIKTVLSGPYTFNETVDDITVNITIDISKYFTAPIQNIKTLLPLHTFRASADRIQGFSDTWLIESSWDTTSFSMYKNDDNHINSIAFDSSYIDSVVEYEWETVVYMNTPIRFTRYIDSTIVAIPLDLTDDAGMIIPFEDIPDLIDAETFLPYFTDYTFNGIFVGMTRQKWLDLIYQ